MKKSIKKNLYAAVDVMAVVTLLLLVVFVAKKDKSLLIGIGASAMLGGAALIVQVLFGQSKIENESGEDVFTKSEEGCNAIRLAPEDARYDIDGVKIHDKVYKLSDGCHAVAKKDGTVKVKSLTGRFINSVRGGVLATPPDECWEPLFKV